MQSEEEVEAYKKGMDRDFDEGVRITKKLDELVARWNKKKKALVRRYDKEVW